MPTAHPIAAKASRPFTPRSTPASTCSTPAIFTAWATTNFSSTRHCARFRERVYVSVKFGALRDPQGAWSGFDGRPAAVKNFVAYYLRRLGVDYIDNYRPARLDPDVPIEDTLGTIADVIKAGYFRHVGLFEVGAATLRRASAVHPISDLQIE